MTPIGHGERTECREFYRIVDWDKLPGAANCVYTVWKPTFMECIKMIFGSCVWVGQKSAQVTQRVHVDRAFREELRCY